MYIVRTAWVTGSTVWHRRKMGEIFGRCNVPDSPRYAELLTKTGENWFCSGWTRKTWSAGVQNCDSGCVCQVVAMSWKICEDCPVNRAFFSQIKEQPRKQLWPYGVTKVQQLEPDKQERVSYCKRCQDLTHSSPGILNITWLLMKSGSIFCFF
jgi:hypothetical protein